MHLTCTYLFPIKIYHFNFVCLFFINVILISFYFRAVWVYKYFNLVFIVKRFNTHQVGPLTNHCQFIKFKLLFMMVLFSCLFFFYALKMVCVCKLWNIGQVCSDIFQFDSYQFCLLCHVSPLYKRAANSTRYVSRNCFKSGIVTGDMPVS